MSNLVSRLLGGAALMTALAASSALSPAYAQASGQGASHAVVQALPSADNKKLSNALQRLGRDAKDVAALIDAGDAARGLQDYAAAIGFYRRADEASPGDARVKAGLGSAFVHNGDPVSAIPFFDAADKAGATPGMISADRGLAYDLVGDNATAQRYYALALPSASGDKADELRNRLAVSQAIGGDLDTAYKTLMPLLNRQDKPGWRTRAFTLAIVGDTDQAVDLVNRILPTQLAQNVAPYLRYMPRLTRAQQAAAANLGRFPRASEIGRDDARIAAYAPPRASAAGAGLIPKGEPLGGGTAKVAKGGKPSRTRGGKQVATTPARTATVAALDPDRVAPPEPKPAIERDSGELPPIGRSADVPKVGRPMTPTPSPTTKVAATTMASTPAASPKPTVASTPASALAGTHVSEATAPSTPAVPAKSSTPGFDLGRVPNAGLASAPAQQQAPAATPPVSAPATPPPVPGPNQLSLSEIFADIGKPTADAMPSSGAVDIRLITPAAPPPLPLPRVQPPKVEEAPPAEDDAKAEKVDPKAKPTTTKTKLADAKATDAKAADTKAADAKAADAKTATAKTAAAKAKEKADAKAKADAEAKAKAKKPSHPSRMWVQIGVGRNKDAIAFDWRRYTRQSPALLKGRNPYVSEMGRTNRILIGPFASQKAASAFLADAKKQGFGDALPWTSPAGQVVDPLSDQ